MVPSRAAPRWRQSPHTGATTALFTRVTVWRQAFRRADLDRDLHGKMVRCRPDPRALQRNRLLRLAHDRDADEVPISDHAARRVEVDPSGSGNVDLDPGMRVAASRNSRRLARCRYPETNRAAIPSERNAAIMSIARSRQLPLPELRVWIGSWVPFSCRAMCLKVRLIVCVMLTRSSRVSADPSWRRNAAAQSVEPGVAAQRLQEAREGGLSSAA